MKQIVFLFISLLAFNLNAQSFCERETCVAVVDVGSSGSRLHVYSYDKVSLQISERWSKKIKPGFATLDSEQIAIDDYLNKLFNDAPEKQLPVYFYATAGMRLLSQPQQDRFYVLLRNWFNRQANWTLVEAKTVTGHEEGVFGWLAANSRAGDKTLAGFMDVGGASVQIAFPVKGKEGINPADLEELNFFGQPLILFSHSFLGLGQTEVSHQFLESPNCFSAGYKLPSGEAATGDAVNCEHEVTDLIDLHQVKTTIAPILQANAVDNWFIFGAVPELVKANPFQFKNGQFTNEELIQQANNLICHQSWASLNAQFPKNSYLYGYCLFPAYYYALMIDGYGLSPQQAIHYQPQESADWTQGVVLYNLLKTGKS